MEARRRSDPDSPGSAPISVETRRLPEQSQQQLRILTVSLLFGIRLARVRAGVPDSQLETELG